MSVAGVSDSEWGAYAAWQALDDSRRELRAKVAASTLDVRQLLASGAMEGPYRAPKPTTQTIFQRVRRAWRNHTINSMRPKP